jgi:hypothetical protein
LAEAGTPNGQIENRWLSVAHLTSAQIVLFTVLAGKDCAAATLGLEYK